MAPTMVIAMVVVPMPTGEVMSRAPIAICERVRPVVGVGMDEGGVVDPWLHVDAFLPIERCWFVVAALDDALAFHDAWFGSVVVGFTLPIRGTVKVGRTGWSGDAKEGDR